MPSVFACAHPFEKLAAIIPKLRDSSIRRSLGGGQTKDGVLAPNVKWRGEVVDYGREGETGLELSAYAKASADGRREDLTRVRILANSCAISHSFRARLLPNASRAEYSTSSGASE